MVYKSVEIWMASLQGNYPKMFYSILLEYNNKPLVNFYKGNPLIINCHR